jgi:hypothetical protein
MSETYREIVMRAALGEQDAVDFVADRLASIDEGQGQSGVRQQLQELEGRKGFLKKVLEWSRRNPDIAFSDEDYLHAVEVDAALAKSYPDMSEEQRLERAADITREALGPAEERDHAAAIAEMARGRSKNATMPNEKSARQGRDQEDIERSQAIEEMRLSRMPHANEAAERAQDRAAREPQRQSMRRAVDFPPR